MLAFVPVAFDLYRPLKPGSAGRCNASSASPIAPADASRPYGSSPRYAGLSKSAVSRRYLAALVEAGVVTRQRRPGGVYDYQIARRFLPPLRPRVPLAERRGVPQEAGTKEQFHRKQTRGARARALDLPNRGVSFGDIPDDARANGRRGCVSWRTSRFWLPLLGTEAGRARLLCPGQLLQAGS